MDPLQILSFLLLFLLSGFFSGSEIAFMSLASHKVHSFIKQGKSGSRALKILKDDQQKLLITILIGNNLVNTLTAALATKISIDIAVISGFEQSLAIGISTGIITLLILLFGEIFPKTLATRYADYIALRTAGFYLILQKIFYPIIYMVDKIMKYLQSSKIHVHNITDEELEAFIEQGNRAGLFEKGEYEKLKNMLDFYEVTAQEVMTPRVQIEAMPYDLTVKEAIEKTMKFTHSRIPIYKETIDNIVWMITVRDLLKAKHSGFENKKLQDLQLIQPLKIPLTKPIHSILDLFKKTRQHIAIVMDEYGGVAGVVSLEDVVEEVFGDIQDELDNEKIAIIRDGNGWIAQGFVMFKDLLEFLKTDFRAISISQDQYDGETLSYFITSYLQRLPSIGEKFELEIQDSDHNNPRSTIVFEILSIKNNAINEVKVSMK